MDINKVEMAIAKAWPQNSTLNAAFIRRAAEEVCKLPLEPNLRYAKTTEILSELSVRVKDNHVLENKTSESLQLGVDIDEFIGDYKEETEERFICLNCNALIDGEYDDNYDTSHDKICCPECGQWHEIDSIDYTLSLPEKQEK